MPFAQEFKNLFEIKERESVSDSFGGQSLGGRAPDFRFGDIAEWVITQDGEGAEQIHQDILVLKHLMTPAEIKYTIESLIRFSFLIELTNLNITSTKMKTRWLQGYIIKTRPNSFENYRGEFSPNNDERAATFQECLNVFRRALSILSTSPHHIQLMKSFSDRSRRGTPYESVITYVDFNLNPLHIASNIRLALIDDATWLTNARPLFRQILTQKNKEKIATKCYKTDRAQTGEVQTNRAKRWECLKMDYQHATIEECWSVEKKLLQDLSHFTDFPVEIKQQLIRSGLFEDRETTVCPITLLPMSFNDFQGGGVHGESKFQVGHMVPLKANGRHDGNNIAWISNDGNRIQGDLDIDSVHLLLRGIFERMNLIAQ